MSSGFVAWYTSVDWWRAVWVAGTVATPVAAIGAALGALFAARAVREAASTARATRESVVTLNRSLELDAIMRLDATLNSPRLLKARVAVARAYRAGEPPPDDVDDIFDLFETIGLLLRKEALDQEMVRSFFATWVFRYVLAHEDYLQRVRADEPAAWHDVRRLYDALLALEERKTKESREMILARERKVLPDWMRREAGLLDR